MYDATTGNYVYSLSFTATTTPYVAPTLVGHAFSVAAGQGVALAPDITAKNPSGDSITAYWVADTGGGGHLTVGGIAETNGQWHQVSNQWSNVQFVGGPSGGTDTLDVAMYDATTGNFVYSCFFTATATAASRATHMTAATSHGSSSNDVTITTGDLGLQNAPNFINAGKSGVNTVTATGSGQTLTAAGGSETLIGYSGFGDTFSGLSAGLNGDTIQLFGGSDVIDLTDVGFSRASTLAYDGVAGFGTLTATDGTHTAKIDFVGNYTAANFHLASDTHGGSLVSFLST